MFLPCKYTIHGLTVMDNISHALFSRSFVFLKSSKIRIPCGIECPSYKQVCFSSFLQDDECFGTQTNSRFRSIYPLTTYNPVMDNLPCESIIYVLTAIDNISHALFGWILCLFPQLSKIRILYRIECPSYKQVCFSNFLQDDECFRTHTNSRLGR